MLRGDLGPREGETRYCPCPPGADDKELPSLSPSSLKSGDTQPKFVCFQLSWNIRSRNLARFNFSKFNFPRWLRQSVKKQSELQSGVNLSFSLLYLLPVTAFEIQINSHSSLLVGSWLRKDDVFTDQNCTVESLLISCFCYGERLYFTDNLISMQKRCIYGKRGCGFLPWGGEGSEKDALDVQLTLEDFQNPVGDACVMS